MPHDTTLQPILKWVGGKRQLLSEILPLIPLNPALYVEPFLGGGSVLLSNQPSRALVNDANSELMNVYKVVRDYPDDLIILLREHQNANSSEHYYQVRALDRDTEFSSLDPIIRAARMIYLNKTCYNGLYRVNGAGQMNSPYGRYRNPNIVNEPAVRALSDYLRSGIELMCGDYSDALKHLPKGAVVYLDPPYMPLSQTSSFTGYTEGGFGCDEQIRLRDECLKLQEQGIKFVASNSDCPEIRDLYRDFEIKTVRARRAINSNGAKRGFVNEVLIIGR